MTSCGCLGWRCCGWSARLTVLGIGYFIPDPARARPCSIGVGVCLFGLTLMDSAIIPLLMVVPALVSYRIGVGRHRPDGLRRGLVRRVLPSRDSSPSGPTRPAMRSLLWCGVIYEVLTLFTVVANPYRANAVEWVHAGLLTAGALVVGWSIGREGHARLGLTLILLDVLGPRDLR